MHVHLSSAEGEAKFWIDPEVSLAQNHGLSEREIRTIQKIIEDRLDEIEAAWKKHFSR